MTARCPLLRSLRQILASPAGPLAGGAVGATQTAKSNVWSASIATCRHMAMHGQPHGHPYGQPVSLAALSAQQLAAADGALIGLGIWHACMLNSACAACKTLPCHDGRAVRASCTACKHAWSMQHGWVWPEQSVYLRPNSTSCRAGQHRMKRAQHAWHRKPHAPEHTCHVCTSSPVVQQLICQQLVIPSI